ncbi:unnamed protein product [Ambrosiozyma monospora]|uniref:Unnamed protein product n=1 Tax=Ambrosiozyma monospora TaxID=43982 RepID=A0A9W6Z2F6_AMBMO|nr:unnamed protein product [Ambrosiozyma monospora]
MEYPSLFDHWASCNSTIEYSDCPQMMNFKVENMMMCHGSWFMVHGSWFMVHGSWFMVHGSWFMVHGSWFMVHGSWFMSLKLEACLSKVDVGLSVIVEA